MTKKRGSSELVISYLTKLSLRSGLVANQVGAHLLFP